MAERPPELLGIPVKELARICRVTERTARRWKDGTRCPPESALAILRRDLGTFDPAWKGWRILGDVLYSPEGWAIPMGDVLAVPLERRALENARAEVRRLHAELIAQEQPKPDEWPDWIAKVS